MNLTTMTIRTNHSSARFQSFVINRWNNRTTSKTTTSVSNADSRPLSSFSSPLSVSSHSISKQNGKFHHTRTSTIAKTSAFQSASVPIRVISSSSLLQPRTGNNTMNFLPSRKGIQKRSLFIQTANTPNPESIKFIPGRPVLGSSSDNNNNDQDSNNNNFTGTNGFYVTSSDKAEIQKSPLCIQLFKEVDGIKSIYLGSDFITITKYAEFNWTHLRPLIFSSIMNFYSNQQDQNNPLVLSSHAIISDTTILDTDDEVVAMIKELLETRIRPAVQDDGGDIKYVNYDVDSGIVYVQLAGSCVGCPSSSVTLKNGVENMLMHYIPEVSGVEAIMDEEHEEDNPGYNDDDIDEEEKKKREEDLKKAKTYEERLRAAGIPFSD